MSKHSSIVTHINAPEFGEEETAPAGPKLDAYLLGRLRAGQKAFLEKVKEHRICAFKARRQYGKTTTLATIALQRMCDFPNHTIIFGTAKLNLATELVRKQDELVAATKVAYGSHKDIESEAHLLSDLIAASKPAIRAEQKELKIADTKTGREIPLLRVDDFAHLFEKRRLEFRIYHSNTTYSRTKIVALTPGTVGETGDMIADEIARVRNWEEVWEAIEPISSANANYRIILSSTPSPDDTSLAFEMLREPPGTQFEIRPEGNWFNSEYGIPVLRLTAWDAEADGVQMYDVISGKDIPVEEHRRKFRNQDVWERNYGVRDITSGTGAIGLLEVESAQRRGQDNCFYFHIKNDDHLKLAKERLHTLLGSGEVGCGWDLATTTEQTSNPSAFTVIEKQKDTLITRLICTWKTDSDEVQESRARQLLGVIAARTAGGRARRLCIDATNERLFARRMQQRLGRECTVELVVASENVPGQADTVNFKTWLGVNYVDAFNRGQLDLPADAYVKEDHRLVRRDRGHFVCHPTSDGKHGDTFDSGKLAFYALTSKSGGITEETLKHIALSKKGHAGMPYIPRLKLK